MKILMLEDERKVAKFIELGLTEENYEVEVAIDGDEGLSLATQQQPDLIILDLLLPKKDGISVHKEIRGKGITTPVLLLAAKSSTEDKVAGLDGRADDYLTKPFSVATLLARDRGGSGLGLSIAKWIGEFHKGQIQVQSKLSHGSTFTVRLPTND